MQNRPSIVDDVTAIQQGMRRIERERRLAQFRLPETVSIMTSLDPAELEEPVIISYILRNHTLLLNKVQSGKNIRQAVDAFLQYLYQYCPSCRSVNDFEIDLDPEDATLLRTLLRNQA